MDTRRDSRQITRMGRRSSRPGLIRLEHLRPQTNREECSNRDTPKTTPEEIFNIRPSMHSSMSRDQRKHFVHLRLLLIQRFPRPNFTPRAFTQYEAESYQRKRLRSLPLIRSIRCETP